MKDIVASLNRLSCYAVSIWLLSACGGGGGGGSAATNNLTLSATTVNFVALSGDMQSDTQDVTATWNNASIAGLVVGTTPSQPTLPSWLSVSASGNTSPVTIHIRREASAPPLAAGTYTFPLRVVTGDASLKVYGQQDITVNYEVVALPTVSPSPVALNWVESEQPAQQMLTLSADSRVQLVQSSVDVAWLSTSASGSTVTLSGNAQSKAQPAGSATATLTTTVALNGHQTNVTTPITATVAKALSGPAQIALTVNASSTAGSISNVPVTISSATQASSVPLTASQNVAWLTANAAATGSTGNVKLTLPSGPLGGLANGVYTGTLTVGSSTPNISPLAIPVSLTVNLPEVQFVAPVAFSDTVATDYVIARGQGLADPAAVFQLGGQPLTAVTVVNDTEIRFTPGTRAAGSYALSAGNQLGLPRGSASLIVVDPPAWGNFSLDHTVGAQSQLIVSDRQSMAFTVVCYFCTPTQAGTNNTLQRFIHDSATDQWSRTQYTYPNLIDIAFTPDESTLLVLTQTDLRFVDPVSMNTLSIVALPSPAGNLTRDLAVTNQGRVIIQSIGQYYDLHSQTFTVLPGIGSFVTTSRDGSRVMFGAPVNDHSQPYQYYDSSTGTIVTSATFEYFAAGSLSRHAERGFSDINVLDTNLAIIGTLPVPSYASDLSPTGLAAYAIDYPSSNNTVIRSFDLSAVPFVEGAAQTLGTVNAVGIGRLVMDPRGNALVVMTEKKFIIIDKR